MVMMVVEEVEVVEVEEVAEVVGIPHHLQVVEEEGVHQMVVNLVLEVAVQVVVEILLSVEMINESANLVPAENHLKAKEMARIEEGPHCVSLVLEDGREERRIVVLSERGTGLRTERERPRPPKNGERYFCQMDLFLLALLPSLLKRNRSLSLSTL